MKLVVLANDVAELKAQMATWLLAWRAASQDRPVWLTGIEDLSWHEGAVTAHGSRVSGSDDSALALAETIATSRKEIVIEAGDVLLLRTNPARDPERHAQHRAALGIARIARTMGVSVLNDPDAIERTGSKLFLCELPAAVRPRQLVTCRSEAALAFARAEEGPVVLKPLWGTRGEGVMKVDLRVQPVQALVDAAELLLATGPMVAQEYLAAAPAGDTRVLLLDGEVITVGGRRAAVRRVPRKGEFRSNVHLGASPARAVWSDGLEGVVAAMGPILRRAGVFLAGIDVVGDKLVEVNAFAPGGFANAQTFEGVDFLGAVVDRLT